MGRKEREREKTLTKGRWKNGRQGGKSGVCLGKESVDGRWRSRQGMFGKMGGSEGMEGGRVLGKEDEEKMRGQLKRRAKNMYAGKV